MRLPPCSRRPAAPRELVVGLAEKVPGDDLLRRHTRRLAAGFELVLHRLAESRVRRDPIVAEPGRAQLHHLLGPLAVAADLRRDVVDRPGPVVAVDLLALERAQDE